ncbi:MAG: hypothetical protein ACXWP0_13625 [Ktedonobacterales bacterium]
MANEQEDRVTLARVTISGLGKYYTEHPAMIADDVANIIRGEDEPRRITITFITMSRMEADTLAEFKGF